MKPYQLIQSVFAHDGPIRSICIGPTPNEIITGCQSDSPNVRRWRLSEDLMGVEEIGSPIFHDHWVTALTALKPASGLPPLLVHGCFVSGCMDSKIRIYDSNGNILGSLVGHSKGVISFSWTKSFQLISGSWDGLAILWDMNSFQQLRSFGPHENGVHVLGLSNGLIATTSTGEAVNSRPDNFFIRIWDTDGKLVTGPIKDHSGPVRSIASLPGFDGFLTTSNDGSVVVRSIEGQVIESLVHPLQEDGSPPFILDCSSLDTESGMDFVSSGEDGSVVVWQGTELLQSIPHSNTVWCVLGWKCPSAQFGDFLTAGHDGMLRIFSKRDGYHDNSNVLQLVNDFLREVVEAKLAKKRGPSSAEIEKAAKWENRGSIPGKSEHQIMVFNRDGALIAAEWTQGSWVFVGEVTGKDEGTITKNDSGTVNGQHYDHVFPVEIETSTGLRSLQLGFNNLENPFVAAQRFIDQNGLGQHYLQEIADWILARSGDGNQGNAQKRQRQVSPTPAATHAALPEVPGPEVVNDKHPPRQFTYLIESLTTFNDIPNSAKMLNKLKEINESCTDSRSKLTEHELVVIENVSTTLENTSYYHSSTIKVEEILTVISMFHKWYETPNLRGSLFIPYDLLRMIFAHPNVVELFKQSKVILALPLFFQRTNAILQEVLSNHREGSSKEIISYQVLLTMIRFLANLLKFEIILNSVILNVALPINSSLTSVDPLTSLPVRSVKENFEEILFNLNYVYFFQTSTNKLVRLSTLVFYQNLFYLVFFHHNFHLSEWFVRNSFSNEQVSSAFTTNFLHHLVVEVISQEKENSLVLLRAFQLLFTLLSYSKWKHFASSFSSMKEFLLQTYLQSSTQTGAAIAENARHWSQKDGTGHPEITVCFRELFSLSN